MLQPVNQQVDQLVNRHERKSNSVILNNETKPKILPEIEKAKVIKEVDE